MRSERGQATVEWVGLVLVAALSLGGLASAVPLVDGRSFGGALTHRIVCAVKRGCDDGDAGLARAYGARDAELLRREAPGIVYEPGERQLPVDWRECRERACADAPDDRDLDAHRSRDGTRATVFVHAVHRDGRTYLQYWFYYPDSNSTFAGSDRLWERSFLAQLATRVATGSPGYPGFHEDDWEGYSVRIGRDGGVSARATSHGHWQWCKQATCHNRWGPPSGWTRVSRGSHAGHIPLDQLHPAVRPRAGHPSRRAARYRPRLPGHNLRERTSTPDAIRLVPLERGSRRYRPKDRHIRPPWHKRAHRDPASDES